MLKKFMYLVVVVTIALSFVTMAKSSLSDGYFEIYNPNNGNTAIVSRDGKKLLSGVNNQSIVYLVRDLFTEKPAYMYKKYIGEEIVEKKEGIGDDTWVYKDTSNRTLFYDLDGKFLFETENFGSLNAVNDKILYSYNNSCYLYDTKGQELKRYEFDAYTSFANDKIALYNYRYSNKEKKIEIYDTDFNLIKTITGYEVDYEKSYGSEKYLIISKATKNDDTVYNFLDSDCNLLFANDVENKSSITEDATEIVFIFDNKVFTYDMSHKKYIATVSEITNEQKAILKAEIDPYRTYNNNNEIDNNIQKIKDELNDPTIYVTAYEFNNKKIYVAEVERSFVVTSDEEANQYEQEGYYVSYNNIYDANAKLLAERLKDVDMEPLEYGFIVSQDKVYDFDMKFVRDLPPTFDLERIEIDDKTYFLDRVDSDYNEKDSQNLYDAKFNSIFEDYENMVFSYEKDWILLTDHKSTKMYDKDLKVLKDLNRKVEAISWQHTDNYITFIDMITKRYGILDKDGNVIIDKLKKIDSLRDDHFVYMNGFRYGIMDYNKNVIVSLSIFDDIKDDSNEKDYIVSEVGY